MGPWTGALAWPWWGRSLPKGNHWECWDPWLGPNVVRVPVHLLPQMPPDTPTPPADPWHPLHPLTSPDVPYSLASGSADPWTGAQCGQAPFPPATPNAPYTCCWSPDIPYTPYVPTPLSVGVLGPWTRAQGGQAPSPSATLMPPTPPANPLIPSTPLPVGVLGPWTWAKCGWAPSPSATSNAPWHPLLTPWCPLYPLPAPDTPNFSYIPAGPLTPPTARTEI